MDLARHLRRKFIVTALSAVTAVLVVIVGCINVVNYIGVLERTDARLDLIERGGTEGASLPDENGPSARRAATASPLKRRSTSVSSP